MFARSISLRLKPNSVAEFTQLIEKETLPLLRKQNGFQDEITFVVPGGAEVVGISLWDQKEHADAYGRAAYPGELKVVVTMAAIVVVVQAVQPKKYRWAVGFVAIALLCNPAVPVVRLSGGLS